MEITYRDAQRIVVGLRRLEENNDTKLSAETRLKIGINMNRLLPNVRLFEKEVNNLQIQMTNGAAGVPGQVRALSDELEKISDTVESYKVKKFKLEEFDLKTNSKIKAETLSMIAPLVRDFDDGSADED